MLIRERLIQYTYLMRLDKPIPMLLLLWPTLWALWLAGDESPNHKIVIIFILGVILMRSAGCVLNDFADYKFDKHVKRTSARPLACGKVSRVEALLLASLLIMLAFLLVLECNFLTIVLAFIGVGLALIYPYLKRITHLPQLGLGLAFSWGVPMAFAALKNSLDGEAWLLFITCLLWPLIYDTMYAMADREEDIKIGVKSSAILFNEMDRCIIALLQTLFVILLSGIGFIFELSVIYYVCLSMVAILFCYQQWLIKDRDANHCFKAFLNNHWVGLIIFAGIFLN